MRTLDRIEAAAALDVLGVERLDHGYSILTDPDLVARVADDRIPLTVCPNSNVRIANSFDRLEDHVYPQLRANGLLATLNTDDPALSDLDLGYEYASVATAFGWGWDDMVSIALDGVEGYAGWMTTARRPCAIASENSAVELAPVADGYRAPGPTRPAWPALGLGNRLCGGDRPNTTPSPHS